MQVFAANSQAADLPALLQVLQSATQTYQSKELKAFALFWNEKAEKLKTFNQKFKVDQVGLALLNGAEDPALSLYQVKTSNATTVVVYKDRKVTASFVNYQAKRDAAKLKEALRAISR